MIWKEKNLEFLKKAYKLACRGIGFTSPNPNVGAVIVSNGKIIGEGWHKKAGSDHAEIVAIKNAISQTRSKSDKKNKIHSKSKESEIYVTLEPCSHQGKTGPCTEALIEAGFRKVWIGTLDPNPKVNGEGVKKLRKAGIEVEVLQDLENQENLEKIKNLDSENKLYKKSLKLLKEIRELNSAFFKTIRTEIPFVTIKAGMSIDGKITANNGQSQWITSEKAREDARKERAEHDAVLVGSGTIEADNPQLATHGKFKNKKFLKIIIDKDLSLEPEKFQIFQNPENIFVATTNLAKDKNLQKYKKNKISYNSFGEKRVNILKLLKFLQKNYQIQSLFVEGGSRIHGSFYDASLKNPEIIDQIIFYIAPIIIGGKESKSAIAGEGLQNLNDKKQWKIKKSKLVNRDLKITLTKI